MAMAVALATSMVASVASADDPLRASVAWDQLGLVLHQGAASLLPRDAPAAEASAPRPWLGTDPHVSLVARDWGMSQVLWGHLTVTDQLRLSRSSRMGVGRLRLAGGRIAPFVQLGVGQWRVDGRVVAGLPADTELAGQVGAGIEVEVMAHAVLALQGDCTHLFPEGREPETPAIAHLWSTLLAARARF